MSRTKVKKENRRTGPQTRQETVDRPTVSWNFGRLEIKDASHDTLKPHQKKLCKENRTLVDYTFSSLSHQIHPYEAKAKKHSKKMSLTSSENREMRALLGEVRTAVTAMMPDIMARRSDVRWKPDGSPVTAADLFVEKQLSDFLTARLSGLVVQGEESWVAGSPSAHGWVAVLDPIDGTENFCSGIKEWGVSLSLWKGGDHAASMLLLPELDACLMTGDQPEKLRSRIVGLSSTVSAETVAVLHTLHEARITGCAVYNLYNVARGAFARFVNPKGAYSWDLLAGVQLAVEHGCSVQLDGLPYDGRFLEPGRRYRIDIQHRYDLHPGQGALG